jgi:long-chain acyl-CoA synthetase
MPRACSTSSTSARRSTTWGEGDDPSKAVPLLHTSTCFVAGGRTGIVREEDPRIHPFPRSDELGHDLWDPRRELEEGMATAAAIRKRKDDPQLISAAREKARERLKKRGHPTTGEVLERAAAKELDKAIMADLVDAGAERAKHWGWPNAYTYTKSVGEQLLADSGVPFTIVRPAVVESSLSFPVPGWNEGINTSAPLIYLALHGQVSYPTCDGHVLDVIPVDEVCYGTVLSTAALLRGEAEMVYQYGTSDANAFTMNRLIEMTGLYKRRFMRQRNRGNPLLNRLYGRIEPVNVSPETYYARSTPAMRKGLKALSGAMKALKGTPAGPVVAPVVKQLQGVDRAMAGSQMVMEAFLPFISELDYRFRCDNTRALARRLSEEDRAKVPYQPEKLDWREYWLEVHIKGLRKWVFPHLEARLAKRPRADERFSDLLALLDEVCAREGRRTALQKLVPLPEDQKNGVHHQLEGIDYRTLHRSAYACATRLADSGIHPGDRVALVAKNSPEWAIGFFGILAAGASVVALDPELDEETLARRCKKVEVAHALLGPSVEFIDEVACLDLAEFVTAPPPNHVVEPPEVLVSPDDVAVIPWTSGTSGNSRPVLLTHQNLTTVLASVAPLFKMGRRDSALSVLPLHNSFELCCGLLLPLLRGARVTYVNEVTAEHLTEALSVAGVTAMIGVPQVWEDLEARIARDLERSGPFAEAAFQAGLLLNRTLGRTLGVNLGRVLFRPVHERLGGRIRFLISTGGHLDSGTADTFKNLGLDLSQAYGLTEGSPVLAVGDAKKGGKAPPGIEVEIQDVSEDGIGEIVTRGGHVMLGYGDEEEGTERPATDAWFRTGDLGRIDDKGRITVVARHNEVITDHKGHRIFPRPIEEALREADGVIDAAVVGVPDGQGGERVAALLIGDELEAIADEDESSYVMRCRAREEALEREARSAVRRLESRERPEVYSVSFEPLPRTADHKVKRTEVIATIVASQARPPLPEREDSAPLPRVAAPRVAPERERLAAPSSSAAAAPDVPPTVQDAVKRALLPAQMAFYDSGMKVRVEGQQHIPHNRQTIVVANHASHLDMGLAKYGLGSYGRDLVTLAAKDYFFEGKWRRAWFENFTNLRPFDRGDSPRESMREASALLDAGKNVLLFPEGTRSSTGEIGAFKSAMAYLALKHDVDILPLYLEGTHRAMPRGAMMPKNRKLAVHIGPTLDIRMIREALEGAGLRMSAQCAKAAEITQRAVEALRDEKSFKLEDAIDRALGKGGAEEEEHPLVALFRELEERFTADNVDEPKTYYFSLGGGPEGKWTVSFDKTGCKIANEKVAGSADCVMKTDVKMFTRIVREHYIPQVSEFMDGTVKTNDPELLLKFVSVFNL